MNLETANTGRNNPAPSDISGIFADPKLLGEFAILSKQPGEFLQAAIGTDGMCQLEYREENPERHFQATQPVALANVEAAFLDYLAGGDTWRTSHEWKPLESGNSGCAKSSALVIALIALSVLISSRELTASAPATRQAQPALGSTSSARQDSDGSAAATRSITLPTEEQISTALVPLLDDNADNFGLIAGVGRGAEPAVVGAVGVRKTGSGVDLTPSDKMHLGSCTKAMTATVVAMLVDEGKLSWEATLPELLPDLEIHEDYRPVTLHMLLTHRSGLPRDPKYIYPKVMQDMADDTARRKYVVQEALRESPTYEPDSQNSYSNLSFITTGYILEVATGQPWQELIQERLFQPLGMTSAGFGPAVTDDDSTDQPWGHTKSFLFGVSPTREDNPSYYGPAGTVHCSLADWAKFAALHMGHQPAGQQLVSPESLKFLHGPRSGAEYASGWVRTERAWADGTVLTHSGSNGRNHCVIWIAPKLDLVFMSATNSSDNSLCDAAIVELLKLCELLPAAN